MAYIAKNYKIVFGPQQGRGVWFGPVSPNGTSDGTDASCVSGCLFDIDKVGEECQPHPFYTNAHSLPLASTRFSPFPYSHSLGVLLLCMSGCLVCVQDPTEHVNLKDAERAAWQDMRGKLLKAGTTLYQTDYAEPGADICISGEQAAAYYSGHNTCVRGGPGYHPSLPQCNETTVRSYLGPMCFTKLPPGIPPVPGPTPEPPTPPPAPTPHFQLSAAGANALCLAAPRGGSEQKQAPRLTACSATTTAWGVDQGLRPGFIKDESGYFLKLNETATASASTTAQFCARGLVYLNDAESSAGPADQGFELVYESATGLLLKSTACEGMCYVGRADGTAWGLALEDCAAAGAAALWQAHPV